MPITTAREREVLDYLLAVATDALMASLPTAHLRVQAALTPATPWPPAKGDA